MQTAIAAKRFRFNRIMVALSLGGEFPVDPGRLLELDRRIPVNDHLESVFPFGGGFGDRADVQVAKHRIGRIVVPQIQLGLAVVDVAVRAEQFVCGAGAAVEIRDRGIPEQYPHRHRIVRLKIAVAFQLPSGDGIHIGTAVGANHAVGAPKPLFRGEDVLAGGIDIPLVLRADDDVLQLLRLPRIAIAVVEKTGPGLLSSILPIDILRRVLPLRVRRIHAEIAPALFEIADAGRFLAAFARPDKRGQQHRGENRDDGDDDEEFNQRKRSSGLRHDILPGFGLLAVMPVFFHKRELRLPSISWTIRG